MNYFKLSNYIVEPEGKIAKRVIFRDRNTLIFILNIAVGKSLPNHTHYDSTVILKVLKGQADVLANGEPVAVGQEDLVQLAGDEELSIINTGQETLAVFVSISPKPPAQEYTIDADL